MFTNNRRRNFPKERIARKWIRASSSRERSFCWSLILFFPNHFLFLFFSSSLITFFCCLLSSLQSFIAASDIPLLRNVLPLKARCGSVYCGSTRDKSTRFTLKKKRKEKVRRFYVDSYGMTSWWLTWMPVSSVCWRVMIPSAIFDASQS